MSVLSFAFLSSSFYSLDILDDRSLSLVNYIFVMHANI